MGFLLELYRLTRFEHALMLAFAVLIAEAVAGGLPAGIVLAISLLVPILSEMGSFALNDYLDMETDRLNRKKDRPLVKGTISPTFALWLSFICMALATALAYLINTPAFIIALVFNALAIAYNWKLKDLPLAGNAYIALTMAVPFVFGNYVVSAALAPANLALALLGFVAGLAREIIKSIQDVEGDVAARGSRTLPVMIGKEASLWMAIALYLLFIPLSALPFLAGIRFTPLSGAPIIAADALILLVCYRLAAQGAFKFARDASLAAFALGMLGYLVAAL
ncbi:MAG: UbiA family prenyltransferase [Candidatus ainarchaeum sp.]|nr:UbiA family prenyltransferase [Candidatus ainarchaeum sp.]